MVVWQDMGAAVFQVKILQKLIVQQLMLHVMLPKILLQQVLADKCEIQISYAIGVAEPTSIFVETFGTGHLKNSEIIDLIHTHFDLTPQGIIDHHDLLRPIYQTNSNLWSLWTREFSLGTFR